MNYRHAYHAGNFADVFKHVLLTRMLVYLMRKEAALRYIETHAGIGLYDLAGEEAQRTGEWRGGIGRIDPAAMPETVRTLMQPWLDATGLAHGRPVLYPGSPLIAQHLMRPQDRAMLCELHPQDVSRLQRNIGRDKRVKAVELDGYVGLKAFIPPPEKRGLVLIDPPFESRDEFARLTQALAQAQAKWPGGTYAIWYPIKDAAARLFPAHLVAAGVTRVLRLDLTTATVQEERPLSATGLVVVNPPYVLAQEARELLAYLAPLLATGQGAAWSVEALTKI